MPNRFGMIQNVFENKVTYHKNIFKYSNLQFITHFSCSNPAENLKLLVDLKRLKEFHQV
jgi:hypothetical protein